MEDVKTITLTAIIKAGSLNYDEGISIISPLKKINTDNGIKIYTSPQCFKYSLYKVCEDKFFWRLSDVKPMGSGDKKVTQKVSSIIESEEVDCFGTMVTFSGGSGYKRDALIRLVPLVSLANYQGDKELLNNMGLSSRINENPNLATIEIERSLYKYSLSIDYDRIGIDEYKIAFIKKEIEEHFGKTKPKQDQKVKELRGQSISIEYTMRALYALMSLKGFISISEDDFLALSNKVKAINFQNEYRVKDDLFVFSFAIKLADEERKKRCNEILESINSLHRDIRGRRENMKPVFCIGTKGCIRVPVFENIVNVHYINDKPVVNTEKIKTFCEKEGINNYKMGGLSDMFINNFSETNDQDKEEQIWPKDVINFLKFNENKH